MNFLIFYLLILVMTGINSLGALFFKDTMVRVKVFSIKNSFKVLTLYLGMLCYLVGSIINIVLLKNEDYSIVYPLTSLSCVWTLVFSKIFLGEKITIRKCVGIPLIVLGTFLVCL